MWLDINTPKGQTTVEEEKQMLQILSSAYPNTEFCHTPLKNPSKVDGFTIKNNVVTSVFESKCRQMKLNTLINTFNNEWLVTFEKIQSGAIIARKLSVPFIGLLFLVPDNLIIVTKITDQNGDFFPPIRLERTRTQTTCNGGEIVRTNAYINVKDSKKIYGESIL